MTVVADQQILRGVAATLSWQNVDGNSEPAAPDGDITVGITRDDGTILVVPGTGTDGTGTDPRTYALTAALNTVLDMLTVTWTDTSDGSTHVTHVDVVGGFLFSAAEARASDEVLYDVDRYPTSVLLETRRAVEEEFEQICDVAFVPRYRRQTLSGDNRSSFLLDTVELRTIRRVWNYSDADDYIAWTVDELATLVVDSWGAVTSRTGVGFAYGVRNLVVAYEHGLDRPPTEVKRAGMQRLRYLLNQSKTGIPDRATSFTVTEGGSYSLDTAGAYKTGQPDVDAVLARYSRRLPGVA